MKSVQEKLNEMLKVASIPIKPSYRPNEVQSLLGISDRTFWRLLSAYEISPASGTLTTPVCLDSFMLCRSRRVSYAELAAYLDRNQSWERANAL